VSEPDCIAAPPEPVEAELVEPVEAGADEGGPAGGTDVVAEAEELLAGLDAALEAAVEAAVELLDEPHAASASAAPASRVAAAAVRPFRLVGVSMDSSPQFR
jgi:hypothetical protein